MESRSKRIAKNTLLLYIRTFVTLLIGVYTGRVMLESLGIENYGIQNVVGGIVAFSSLMVGSMSSASSRYITYSLGEGDLRKTQNTFITVTNVQLLLATIVAVLLEIFGVYFLNHVANIPANRMYAANWVLQFSIISTFVTIANVPFSSDIIAHEKMGIYAYLSMFDAVAKLSICYIILYYKGDRLILYSLLYTISGLITAIIYLLYCRKNFAEVCYRFYIDKSLFKEITKFSGWNFLHYFSWIMSTQGVNFLINIFFGVNFNAARGVANTVGGAVKGFVYNFTTAFNPQITKSYANKEYDYTFSLVNKGTKYSWYLMYLFVVPVCIEANTILKLWLVEVPPMANIFLIFTMFESIALLSGESLYKLILSDGRVKRYSIAVAIYQSLIFPLSWVAYKLHMPVWSSYPIFIFVFLTINIIRLRELHRLMGYQWKIFVDDVVWPCLRVSVISFIIPLICVGYIHAEGFKHLLIMTPICLGSVILTIYIFGLDRNERRIIKSKVTLGLQKIPHLLTRIK
ncbi:MAG: hypothetical protein K2M56_09505 [Muribaculaceae bacterium]|nr:hypothetical protein [Muribaculaceae bacterium]